MWQNALSAKLRRLWDCASQGYDQKSQRIVATNTYHSARITKAKLSPEEMPSLELRAHRLHNRNREAAARYLRRHQTLAKGVCFDAKKSKD